VTLTYSVALQVALPITKAQFNQTAFVLATANASGCGTCTNLTSDPAICSRCKIALAVADTPAARRLLTGITVNVSIITNTSVEATAVSEKLVDNSTLAAAFVSQNIANAVVDSPPAIVVTATPVVACPTSFYCPGDGVAHLCAPGTFGI
jgi:hypothetical protein